MAFSTRPGFVGDAGEGVLQALLADPLHRPAGYFTLVIDGGMISPHSAIKPRMRLAVAVRSTMNPSRARCSDSIACYSSFLIGTKRMVG